MRVSGRISGRPPVSHCLVVGGGALGTAIARRMAQHHKLFLADIDGAKVEAIAAEMNKEGFTAEGFACDVTKPDDIQRLIDHIAPEGKLDALVYVVGLSPSLGDFKTIMQVNLMGAALLTEALEPHIHCGTVAIFIASLAAHASTLTPEATDIIKIPANIHLAEKLAEHLGPDATSAMAYVHSKHGLLLHARKKATTWGAKGARILTLSPGLIATPQGALEFQNSPGKRRMFEASPLQRECTMQEIADVVEFLASERASFISGTDILVDGGLSAAMRNE